MCNPAEHYNITVPPRYEDLKDEKRLPFPPPTSPASVSFTGKSSRGSSPYVNSQGDDDQGAGALLLSLMEERPMANQKEPWSVPDMEKLLSENGIYTLHKVFENTTFKGEGHEVEDLHALLEGYRLWAQQLFPHHAFEDVVTYCEEMGSLSEIQTRSKDVLATRTSTSFAGCEDKGVSGLKIGIYLPVQNKVLSKAKSQTVDQKEHLADVGILAEKHLHCNITEQQETTAN